MYSKEQITELQERSISLLNKTNNQVLILADINPLRDVLRFHEHQYYILNDPLLSDFEYDQLYKGLEFLETQNPDSITVDSPTQRVAKGLTKDFPTVQHLVPMLSLDNSYNEEDLLDFDRKAKELSGLDSIEYCVEPKFDGASISLIYENDLLVRAATRGDGVEGDEITTNVKQIRSLPLSAKFSVLGIDSIEIRGEVLINKSNFKKYNELLIEQGSAPLANPRNAAAGSMRIKDSAEVSKRNLEAFVYHVSYFSQHENTAQSKFLKTHSGALEMLWNLGFRSPFIEKKTFNSIEGVVNYCMEYESKRDGLPYEIDGMVIKVNDLPLQEKMGMTAHHPRWAIAYKFKARQGTSKLLSVEYQVGRTGAVTPVAKIQATAIGGVTVTSISLFNEDVIKEKDLMIGDSILIERAGDVIPYIVKSFSELRTGNETEIVFPKTCPACNDALYKPEEEAVWRCININCEAQVVERIIHFVSKSAMDIRGLGDANIRKFHEMNLLKNISGIYTFDFQTIGSLEGFGSKSVEKLKEAIENSKTQPLNRLIFGLGIRYVGETTAKIMAHAVNHLLDFKKLTLEDLLLLEDVGPKVAGSIIEFFQNKDNILLLEELESLGIQLKNEKKELTERGRLEGQTFLFTGSLPTLKRADAELMVEKNGGKIVTGVSSKLNYLVVGEDAGSKLEKAKKINSVKIISEDEFLKMLS